MGSPPAHEFIGPSFADAHVNLARNAVASLNIFSCVVIAAVPVQEEIISRLNAEAEWNMLAIFVTCDTSQLSISLLNA